MSTAVGRAAPAETLDAGQLPELLVLEDSGFPPRERWGAQSWTSELSRPANQCLGLRSGGRLVAAGLIGVLHEDAELLRIVVAPAHRGRGLATGLLARLLAAAAVAGARRMLLEVRHDNTPALALYERAGFTRTGVRANYYGPGADALLMQAVVTPPDTNRPGAAEGGRP
ncbi:GNAT family N-acetyltransferase [Propionibacterium australiense]|uniref:Gcn5-related N-acetyltransferase (GNAT) domain profile n=1 Tax=Propionibacterium australiense TaxID=119981 RepID=A0A383S5R4_9ACTN|nr:GNAT family N-acetyltransferase [Propionibacterium australiense]RLP08739.1 GNAT family N-acetyltransferase [Propionibacterium australiense]SYZ33320.1 Gcn5-related N-acetyltransferase (GNAT) domain profile [Propionibacterium australiense]VEH89777.1 ribosomal-protein-alanine N-acetyltransferase [Propionibacterium australiense]